MHRVSARVRRRRAGVTLVLLVLVVLLTTSMVRRHAGADDPGRSAQATATGDPALAAGAGATPAAGPGPTTSAGSAGPSAAAAPATDLGVAAGLGASTTAGVPAASTQVVVVRGDGAGTSTAAIELYERGPTGWARSASWRGHVGARGWTTAHREGDLRTPVGTFALSDAGGRLADPGTALPYHRSTAFVPSGDSVFGDSLEGSFDYVLAVDYNRRAGRSPLDQIRPLGYDRGGGIWLHVDHDGPTHGCVSVPVAGMRDLLRALSPERRPVVVMGDAARLRA